MGSAKLRKFGRAMLGTLAVPRKVLLGSAKFGSAIHVGNIGSAMYGSLAVLNMAVPRFPTVVWQCQIRQSHVRKFGSATYGSLAVLNLAVPRTDNC